MFKLVEPYQKRPIRFLELWEQDGWRLKVYSLACQMPLAVNLAIAFFARHKRAARSLTV
jgi:hypothetical protein